MLLRSVPFVLAAALLVPVARAESDQAIEAHVERALKGHAFRNLHASVREGVVTLDGAVGLYAHRIEAKRRVAFVRGVRAVRDQIQVVSVAISDQRLKGEIERKLGLSSRRMYVEVHDGVVTLGGYSDRRFHVLAVAMIVQTPGVKNFHDVCQTRSSPLDDPWGSPMPTVSVGTQ